MLAPELIKLGLSPEESKVYLAVLELGGAHVSLIAKKAQVNRVACYHTLGKLIKRGLINSLEKNKIKYFTIENPKTIVTKQRELLQKAEKLLPELLALRNSSSYNPKIQYYEGLEGIKNIFEDTLDTKELLGYTNLAQLPNVIPEDYLKQYAKNKLAKNIKTRMLSPISKKGLRYLDTYYPKNFDRNLVEILFINPKQFMFEYEINIYGDKVSIVSLNPDELIGLIIESPFYSKTQRGIFNLSWLGATSFVAK